MGRLLGDAAHILPICSHGPIAPVPWPRRCLGDWVAYIPLFHAGSRELIEDEGYKGDPVAVIVRIECDEVKNEDDPRKGEGPHEIEFDPHEGAEGQYQEDGPLPDSGGEAEDDDGVD